MHWQTSNCTLLLELAVLADLQWTVYPQSGYLPNYESNVGEVR